jgi:hypothetical protein
LYEGPATRPGKKIAKLKNLNKGTEPDGLMDADESEYKGIRIINYVSPIVLLLILPNAFIFIWQTKIFSRQN